MDECSSSSLADAIRRPAAHVAWRFATWRGGVLRPRKMAGVRCERNACATTGNETGAEIKSGLATAASPRLAAASRAAARTGTAARAENMKCLAAGSFEREYYQPLDPTRQSPHSGPSSRRSDAAMSWSARRSDLRSGFAAGFAATGIRRNRFTIGKVNGGAQSVSGDTKGKGDGGHTEGERWLSSRRPSGHRGKTASRPLGRCAVRFRTCLPPLYARRFALLPPAARPCPPRAVTASDLRPAAPPWRGHSSRRQRLGHSQSFYTLHFSWWAISALGARKMCACDRSSGTRQLAPRGSAEPSRLEKPCRAGWTVPA